MQKLVWIVVAVVVLGGAYWWWQGTQTPAMTGNEAVDAGGVQQTMPVPGSDTPEMVVTAPMTATITYNGTSFSPSSVTIKKGGTVAWNNEGTKEMWVATAQHPNHTIYSGTSRTAHCPDTSKTAFDQCAGGNNYTFKFDKIGTWNYHDHLNATAFGSVTVVE